MMVIRPFAATRGLRTRYGKTMRTVRFLVARKLTFAAINQTPVTSIEPGTACAARAIVGDSLRRFEAGGLSTETSMTGYKRRSSA
jgi:hypothetical protein